MQVSNQNNQRKSPVSFLLSIILVTVLFSCSKSTEELAAVTERTAIGSDPVYALHAANAEHSVPFNQTYFVSCANGGAGEDVELKGNLNVAFKYTVNDNRYTLSYNSNAQGLTGTGLITGDRFVGSGGTQGSQSGTLSGDQISNTFTEQLRITGAGGSFIVKYKFHVTVTPDGRFTSAISDDQSTCITH